MRELKERLIGKRIEWYPSAGDDLMNVWSAFRRRQEPSPRPNVFIHTDWWYAEGGRNDFPDEIKKEDISLRKVKEFPRMPACSHGFCVFGRGEIPNVGRCVEYDGEIFIDGRIERFSLFKIAVENEQFAAEFLLPNQICLEALVHKKCGWGCGGGATIPGTWMRVLLTQLPSRYFVTDQHGMNGTKSGREYWVEGLELPGLHEVSRIFPSLAMKENECLCYRMLWDECWELWSPHGCVRCFEVMTHIPENKSLSYSAASC